MYTYIPYKWFLPYVLCTVLLCAACKILYIRQDNSQQLIPDQIWEVAESPNRKHWLASVITHEDGPELYLDGKRITKDNLYIEFSPAINNGGDFAYALAEKNYGVSKIILNDKVIFDHGTFCAHLAMTDNYLLFSSSNFNKQESSLYIYCIKTRKSKVLKSFKKAFVNDIQMLWNGHAAVLVKGYEQGRKCTLYDINLEMGGVSTALESEDRMFFTKGKGNNVCVDLIPVEGNENMQFLLNSWYWFYHYQYGEPFSHGNDFCGRLSWNEAYRFQGILELYRKTRDSELRDTLCVVAKNILDARNGMNGIPENAFNPSFLWASRRSSIDGQPVSLMANNGLILDGMIAAANEGILEKDTADAVYDIAKKAFEYYESSYMGKGQYRFLFGMPVKFDGVALPWNQQNAMASVWLELWKATGEEKYLQRVEEMLEAFRAEWTEENGKIRWYYWPKRIYDGWEDSDGVSKNTPSWKRKELSTVLFEDISHAGLSAGVMAKYCRMRSGGVITDRDLKKVQENMDIWCLENVFVKSTGGFKIKSYYYVPTYWWGYFYNRNLARYICYGDPWPKPDWNSQTFFPLSALYYQAGIEGKPLTVKRYVFRPDGKLEKELVFSLQEKDIKAFVRESYGIKRKIS